MITLTPCPAGATPLRPGTAHIAISQARSPGPAGLNAGAAEQGQPGDVLPEDRSAVRHHQRASKQVGQTDEHQLSRDGLRSLVTNNRGHSRTKPEVSPEITFYGRLHVITYRATLDIPREVVWFLAKLLAAERQRRGTPRGSRAPSM